MKINLKPHSKEKYNLSLSMVRCMQTVADQLIKVEKVQVLIGSQAWQEAAIVADVGNRAQVPVISHAASSVSPKLTYVRWPFLVQMTINSSKEMESVTSIVHSYTLPAHNTVYTKQINEPKQKH
ncbi:hypothetical protein POM88_031014 [Heracleum sosnowskyi]|uniref:Receptor ligand binding region domain-containing protein n=1 Tax=Heracleum sosnowskyi TaxID=360622 RepID=A0AAD8MIQ9_9APIA|nr:hypothetical protein POM88_031014 [Heracleum sosnowskyi]